MRKLKLYQSIPLGVGSIIGSGILFLPSLTYKTSGPDVLVSWLLIIFLCIPGIFCFKEMIHLLRPDNTSLSGMVELGFGKEVGVAVNTILLGTVVFGMPSAAIVAGEYCKEALNLEYLRYLVPFLILFISLLVNYRGLRTSAFISFIISAALIIISVYLIMSTVQPLEAYKAIKPDFELNNIYAGAVLSFWAFAGFENLTFLYDKFQNPKRDLILTIFVSITVCGLIYLGLVANYSAVVPYMQIRHTVGLIQMIEYSERGYLPILIASFALLAVGINLISWVSGVSQLVIQSSAQKILPSIVGISSKNSILFLGLLYSVSLCFGLYSPYLFEQILKTVSTNFLLLYLLLIVSYFIIAKSILKKTLAGFLGISLLVTLSSSSYLLFYPFGLFLITIFRMKKHV